MTQKWQRVGGQAQLALHIQRYCQELKLMHLKSCAMPQKLLWKIAKGWHHICSSYRCSASNTTWVVEMVLITLDEVIPAIVVGCIPWLMNLKMRFDVKKLIWNSLCAIQMNPPNFSRSWGHQTSAHGKCTRESHTRRRCDSSVWFQMGNSRCSDQALLSKLCVIVRTGSKLCQTHR